jgi:putative tricarboxylic transport membrane protein
MDIGGIPVSPMILGFILGPMVEVNLRRGLTYSKGSFFPFLMRPVSLILLLIGIASILMTLLRKPPAEKKDGGDRDA